MLRSVQSDCSDQMQHHHPHHQLPPTHPRSAADGSSSTGQPQAPRVSTLRSVISDLASLDLSFLTGAVSSVLREASLGKPGGGNPDQPDTFIDSNSSSASELNPAESSGSGGGGSSSLEVESRNGEAKQEGTPAVMNAAASVADQPAAAVAPTAAASAAEAAPTTQEDKGTLDEVGTAQKKEKGPSSERRRRTTEGGAGGGGVKKPSNEPVTCQVACLSWAGSKDGFRKTNQDAYCFLRTKDKKSLLFGVFDGHGPQGHEVAKYMKEKLPEELMLAGEDLRSNTRAALEKGFTSIHHKVVVESSIDCSVSGTTAVLAHLYQRQLSVAWAGDSRAIIGQRKPNEDGSLGDDLEAVQVSIDHKPEREGEKERVEASNGSVYRDVNEKGEDVGPYRVWMKTGPMLGLAMSRSLGDRLAHTVGVEATPEVTTIDLTPAHKFLILASDGVWEFVSNEDAVAAIQTAPTLNDGVKALMSTAKARWQQMDEGNYVDDITALVVGFTHREGML